MVIPKGFLTSSVRENTDDLGNKTVLSVLYRGRRYVYNTVSEYHAGLDMYLEKYELKPTRIHSCVYSVDQQVWDEVSLIGSENNWYYHEDRGEPELAEIYSIGDIVQISHETFSSIYI
jgi:hypothetical protein